MSVPDDVREVMANAVWGRPRDGHSAQKLELMCKVLSALKEAGWVCVPVRATYEIETAVRPCDFPRPDIYGDIDANDAEAFLASAWTAMLTATQKQKP